MHRRDLTGKTFGRLTVLYYAGKAASSRHSMWECECECGEIKEILGTNLTRGVTKSCGCLLRDISTKHGMSDRALGVTPLEASTYKSWRNLLARCSNPNDSNYKNYGGRGITVCARWLTYSNFLEDMGVKSFNETIERLDVNGNYELSNCIWLDAGFQSRNTRNNIMVEMEGRQVCLAEACEILGLKYGTVHARIHRGWDIEKALGTTRDCRFKATK